MLSSLLMFGVIYAVLIVEEGLKELGILFQSYPPFRVGWLVVPLVSKIIVKFLLTEKGVVVRLELRAVYLAGEKISVTTPVLWSYDDWGSFKKNWNVTGGCKIFLSNIVASKTHTNYTYAISVLLSLRSKIWGTLAVFLLECKKDVPNKLLIFSTFLITFSLTSDASMNDVVVSMGTSLETMLMISGIVWYGL